MTAEVLEDRNVDEVLVAPSIGQAVLKIHSRCDLACDHCYEYPADDDSWKQQPKLMTLSTVQAFADRLTAYLEPDPPNEFDVILHGGEPSLAGAEFIDEAAQILRETVTDKTVLQFHMQTNGLHLTEQFLEMCLRNSIRIKVSLDGDREANDRHRTFADGRSSYDKVVEGIGRMTGSRRYSPLYQGVLTTVDLKNDPLNAYEALLELSPPSIDFLLPHGNWERRPPGLETEEQRQKKPYFEWYKKIIDAWYPNDAICVRIRTFDSIIRLLSGRQSYVESIGGGNNGIMVIRTNGTYELVDTLNSAPGHAQWTGMSVHRHSIEQAAVRMAEIAERIGANAVSATCRPCPVYEKCGRGYLPHRFGNGDFANPSVFCLDLAATIAHMAGKVYEHQVFRQVIENQVANPPSVA